MDGLESFAQCQVTGIVADYENMISSLYLALIGSLVLAATTCGTVAAQRPDQRPTDPAQDAYLDQTARRLILGVKEARDTASSTIDSYTALIRERMGIEVPGVRRNWPSMHGERTIRVRWSREERDVVHVLGARFTVLGVEGTSPSGGLATERFAIDPMADPFRFGFAVFVESQAGEATVVRSPLESGSELYYQFRSGDTISIQLSDGHTVHVVSVTVIPRYPSIRHVAAMMWIDPESFGVARVAYRLAEKIDRELSWEPRRDGRWGLLPRVDIGPLDASDSALASKTPTSPPSLFDRVLNGVLNNSVPRFELDLSTVIADYALWEERHWLPRSVRMKGYATLGEGITATGVATPSIPVWNDWTLEIEDIRARGAEAAVGTPATATEAVRLWRQPGDIVLGEFALADPGEAMQIIPTDWGTMAISTLLPPPYWEDDQGVDDSTLDAIESDLAAIGTGRGGDQGSAPSPWIFDPPVKTLRLLRYNPVEHISVGTRLRRDFSWGRAALTTRIGTAGLEVPDIDLTLQRDYPNRRVLVSLYRALRYIDLGGRGTDKPGLYVNGDATDFHWARGAAIRFLPRAGERNWLSLDLFAEQDAYNVADSSRNRFGAAVAWQPWWNNLGSKTFGGGGGVNLRAAAGDNPHVRALIEGAVLIQLPARLSLGLQTGWARVWGDPALQDHWRIGATGDWLRGHEGTVRATRIQMARVDVQRLVRFFRLSVFGDWASAAGDDYYAWGVGLVLMGGGMRLDLARGMRWGSEGALDAGWQFHLLGDAFF